MDRHLDLVINSISLERKDFFLAVSFTWLFSHKFIILLIFANKQKYYIFRRAACQRTSFRALPRHIRLYGIIIGMVAATAFRMHSVGDLCTCRKINDTDSKRLDIDRGTPGILVDSIGGILPTQQ